jgi:SNF2 family DNA or RNA helicase
LRERVAYRRISTGTPIAKNIVDSWTQFNFLDPRILGHKYMSSFRARYCVMGGWEGKQIIGQKNTEEFYQMIAPHSYRLTKAEVLDLPPKQYVVREYDMSDRTWHHYRELRDNFLTQFEDGSITDVANAAVALLRLQQIVCGAVPSDSGTQDIGTERIEQCLEVVRQVSGPVIIWARFRDNIAQLQAALEREEGDGSVVTYYGDTNAADRKKAVEKFLGEEARFFVSNPAAGGVGLNLQGKCQNVIYYSNSFNYVERIQSEDRTHRIGTVGQVTYFDLVARKSVDRLILRNLRTKSEISQLTFDQIRRGIVDTD